jgi:tetratricopeptide (TPR) repeat protein
MPSDNIPSKLRLKSILLTIVLAGALSSYTQTSTFAQPENNDKNNNTQQQNYFVNGKPATRQEYEAGSIEQEGLQFLKSGDKKAAISKFEDALKLNPKSTGSKINLALCFSSVGREEEAIQQLKETLQIEPDNDLALKNLASTYQKAGMLAEAITTMEDFLKRFPDNQDAGFFRKLLPALKNVAKTQKKIACKNGNSSTNNGVATDYLNDIPQPMFIKWPAESMPVKVFIADGQDVTGYLPSFIPALIQAFDDWSKASDGLFKYQLVNSPKHANIVCRWTDNVKSLHNKAEAGEVVSTFDPRKGLISGKLAILTTPITGRPLTPASLKRVCLHEVGHALGFQGHSLSNKDIMFYSDTDNQESPELSPRDINSVKRLYGKYSN